AVLVCQSGPIRPVDLGLDERASVNPPPLGGANAAAGVATHSPSEPPGSGTLSEVEREAIHAALGRARGVVSRAAAELGLSRQALYRRMERLGIEMERRVR
ncbi:MAG TPA: helix-turn-helix domain-containing protein, partial [Polyangiaceae bacterium]|nr:helix-turn-helix domain-containing protein [Polyangiaceae bacterium]